MDFISLLNQSDPLLINLDALVNLVQDLGLVDSVFGNQVDIPNEDALSINTSPLQKKNDNGKKNQMENGKKKKKKSHRFRLPPTRKRLNNNEEDSSFQRFHFEILDLPYPWI